jgi:hypothetical protein
VEGLVTAQAEEARIPADEVALAAGDDRAQVVIDALARDAAEQVEDERWPSRNDSSVISKEK